MQVGTSLDCNNPCEKLISGSLPSQDSLDLDKLQSSVYFFADVVNSFRFVLSLPDNRIIKTHHGDANPVQALGLTAGFGLILGPVTMFAASRSLKNSCKLGDSYHIFLHAFEWIVGACETVGGASLFSARVVNILNNYSSISIPAAKLVSSTLTQIGVRFFGIIFVLLSVVNVFNLVSKASKSNCKFSVSSV